ncbi:MAG TPA: hypothetical protein VLU92_03885 [Candidatus Dormibacteraeota bacterium]|nr:hypothetical protein [Candidatus Dormibacteraeota bacterium]
MIRRATKTTAEVVIWLAFIWLCLLAVSGPGAHTQSLTAALIWAAPQMAGMLVGPFVEGVSRWIAAGRFVIADWVVLVVAADALALALVSSHRWAEGWQPRVRLGEWMEFPRLARPRPAPVTVPAVDEINRRFAEWGRVAASQALTGATSVGAWFVERAIPGVGRGLQQGAHAVGAAGRRVAIGPQLTRGATRMRAHDRLKAGVAPQLELIGNTASKPPRTHRRSEKNVSPRSNRPERLAS